MYQDLRGFNALVSKAKVLAKQKQDFLVPANELTITSGNGKNYLNMKGRAYPLTEQAQRQLAETAGIPYNYYQRLLKDYPDLLDESVNTLLADIYKNKLVRTLQGKARALLSDRYKKVEHEDLLQVIEPIITDQKLTVASCSITPDKMFLKVVNKAAKAEINVGDVVQFGCIIQNSEVGLSAVHVVPFCYRLVCTNGMQMAQYSGVSRKIHLGKQLYSLDDQEEFNADAYYRHVSESVSNALDPVNWLSVVERMKEATAIKVADPMETTERLAKVYSLSPAEKAQVLFHLFNDKDLSLYGLANAVTRTAQDAINYTRATEIEEIGGRVLYEGLKAMKNNSAENPLFLSA